MIGVIFMSASPPTLRGLHLQPRAFAFAFCCCCSDDAHLRPDIHQHRSHLRVPRWDQPTCEYHAPREGSEGPEGCVFALLECRRTNMHDSICSSIGSFCMQYVRA